MKSKNNQEVGAGRGPVITDFSLLGADKWLEHMEQEMEPMCQSTEAEDLERLLKNSPDDRFAYESLTRLRNQIRKSDDVLLPESGFYYDNLHSKIMASIDAEIASQRLSGRSHQRVRSKFVLPQFLRTSQAAFGAAGMMMMVAIGLFIGVHQTPVTSPAAQSASAADLAANHDQQVEEHFERKLAAVDTASSASFARDMGAYESEEDFLTEAAASRLKQVTKRQADAMIRSLM